jgi:hypothetical protein
MIALIMIKNTTLRVTANDLTCQEFFVFVKSNPLGNQSFHQSRDIYRGMVITTASHITKISLISEY